MTKVFSLFPFSFSLVCLSFYSFLSPKPQTESETEREGDNQIETNQPTASSLAALSDLISTFSNVRLDVDDISGYFSFISFAYFFFFFFFSFFLSFPSFLSLSFINLGHF